MSSTLTFTARFTRWSRSKGQRHLSAPITLQSRDWSHAAGRADDMLRAMSGTDTDSEYAIASLTAEGLHCVAADSIDYLNGSIWPVERTAEESAS